MWSWSALSRLQVIGCLVAACGGGDLVLPADGNIAIRVVDGDGQRGPVGQPLDAPVVVEVTDAGGEPVEGATVEFVLTSAGAGAGITPSTARTSAEGRAQAQVLLGDKVGVQTGEARVAVDGPTMPKTTFSALAVSDDNRPPTADFGWSCDDLTCQFTDASTDSDGSVTGWVWRFGDGTTSAEPEPSHSYAAGGTYTVTLTVTDDEGSSDDSSDEVTATAPSAPPPPPPPPPPPAPNEPPEAEFEVDCQDLRCAFVDRSSDEDGSVVSWQWDFGDGATSSQRNPSHSYAAPGRYDVLLLVTDDDGAADTRVHPAEPEAPPPPPPPPAPNDPPQADFDVHCSHLTCTFADKSKDDDGTIVSWAWSFGDGDTSTEQNPVHTYAGRGRYDVLLTVTDNLGATDTKTRRADAKD